jgi:transposase
VAGGACRCRGRVDNWTWLVDGLQAAGLSVHLANTTAIKQYDGLKHSGDETDARHLAHLLRLGIRPTGTILPRKARNVRDLARKRMWCAAVPPTFSQ